MRPEEEPGANRVLQALTGEQLWPIPVVPSHRPVRRRGHPARPEDTEATGQGALAAAVGDPDAAMGSAPPGPGHYAGPGAAESAGHPAGHGRPSAAPPAPPRHLLAALACLPLGLPGRLGIACHPCTSGTLTASPHLAIPCPSPHLAFQLLHTIPLLPDHPSSCRWARCFFISSGE